MYPLNVRLAMVHTESTLPTRRGGSAARRQVRTVRSSISLPVSK